MKNKLRQKNNKRRGFTILMVFLCLILGVFFAFMRQTNEIVELTSLQKKITNQLRENDSLNYLKPNGFTLPAER